MPVLFRHSFRTAIFSRFLKVAIGKSDFMNEFYNDGFSLKMEVLKERLKKKDMEKVG